MGALAIRSLPLLRARIKPSDETDGAPNDALFLDLAPTLSRSPRGILAMLRRNDG